MVEATIVVEGPDNGLGAFLFGGWWYHTKVGEDSVYGLARTRKSANRKAVRRGKRLVRRMNKRKNRIREEYSLDM